MGPLGAHMGPWVPGIGIGIGPLNFQQNFEWKNGKTHYCRTKNEHFRFGWLWRARGALGGPRGPCRASGGPWLKQAHRCHSKKVCKISVA